MSDPKPFKVTVTLDVVVEASTSQAAATDVDRAMTERIGDDLHFGSERTGYLPMRLVGLVAEPWDEEKEGRP